MKIVRDTEIENEILSHLQTRRAPSISTVTTLIQCPLKTYWRITDPQPQTTETTLQRLRGKSHHAFIELPPLSEIKIEKEGITGRIDMIHSEIPVEIISTMRSAQPEEFTEKIRQLAAYTYMTGKQEGILIIYKVSPPQQLTAHRIQFTEEEIKQAWNTIQQNRLALIEALQTNTPPIPFPSPGECRTCEYNKRCYTDLELTSIRG